MVERDARATSEYRVARAAIVATSAFCYWCGRYVSPEFRTAEHLLPLSARGGNKSLVMACMGCNSQRGGVHPQRFDKLPDGTVIRTETLMETKAFPSAKDETQTINIECYSDYWMATFRWPDYKPGEELFAADFDRAVALSDGLLARLREVHETARKEARDWCVAKAKELSYSVPAERQVVKFNRPQGYKEAETQQPSFVTHLRLKTEPELRANAKQMIVEYLAEAHFGARSSFIELTSPKGGSVMNWMVCVTGEKAPRVEVIDELLEELMEEKVIEPAERRQKDYPRWKLVGKNIGAINGWGRPHAEVEAELRPRPLS